VKILRLKVRLTEIIFLIVRLITIKIFNRCPALIFTQCNGNAHFQIAFRIPKFLAHTTVDCC